jgi:hypothetical protein
MGLRIVPLQHGFGLMEPLRDGSFPWWTAVFPREHADRAATAPSRQPRGAPKTLSNGIEVRCALCTGAGTSPSSKRAAWSQLCVGS